MKRRFVDYLLISLKGLAMGMADVIPGVSGGTIAFIAGVYDELVNSIKNIPVALKRNLSQWQGWGRLWADLNGNFLLALVSGIGVSILSLANLMTYLLDIHPIPVWSFFFGLILTSTWYVLRDVTKWNIGVVLALLVGGVSAYWITVITPTQTPEAYWFVFLSGAIAICAMILPGISGSFILLLLGKYFFILNALTTFNIPVILVFVVGAITGLLLFSNILSHLLKYWRNVTVAVLGGFMLGSLNKVWPWKQVLDTFVASDGTVRPLLEKNVIPSVYTSISGVDSQLPIAIVFLIIGAAVILIVEFVAIRMKKYRS